jgi:hypothetical protein
VTRRVQTGFLRKTSPRVTAAKSVSLDVFKIGQRQGPARS